MEIFPSGTVPKSRSGRDKVLTLSLLEELFKGPIPDVVMAVRPHRLADLSAKKSLSVSAVASNAAVITSCTYSTVQYNTGETNGQVEV